MLLVETDLSVQMRPTLPVSSLIRSLQPCMVTGSLTAVRCAVCASATEGTRQQSATIVSSRPSKRLFIFPTLQSDTFQVIFRVRGNATFR